ncbi:uncharacterized protein LOC119547605 [Drosophila subpulchrella]|uniref:uncharacterized protein LOC119547605 n=1 Tax=Drosophila subpulchrella TaxID=1486046 RepID=UPI0018A1A976|nr:uncharacterized protein LOC119547605 [Drosophila subpulchrella]
MEYFITCSKGIPLHEVQGEENRALRDMDRESIRGSYHRRRRNNIILSDSSDSETRINPRTKSRIPLNRAHSIPRKYISKNQLDRQIRAAVVDAFKDCIKAPRCRSENEAVYGKHRRHPKCIKDVEKVPTQQRRHRSQSADGAYHTDHDKKKAVQVLFVRSPRKSKNQGPVYQEALEENNMAAIPKANPEVQIPQQDQTHKDLPLDEIISQMSSKLIRAVISMCILTTKVFINLRLLQAIDRFTTRMSKSSWVSLALFLVFILAWAYEFGEPLARISEAVGDLFKDRTRAWWNII